MKYRLFLLIFATILLSSCSVMKDMVSNPVMASTEPSLNAEWQGCTYGEIVKAFGAPTRTASDGVGGTIYVYEDIQTTYTTSTSTFGHSYSVDSETTATTMRQYKEFYVNNCDSCYLVRSNIMEPTGKRKFAPFKALVSGLATGTILVVALAFIG
ncbi:MAG: hypothetical protein MJZ09_08800 [Bacteroidales bacterium]|nr:hypothetical protein [Bacteroidales bacterium]